MQKEILVGTLLGDDCAGAQASASMPFRKSKPVLCVKFEQNISKAHRLGRRPRTHNDPHHDHFILRSLAAARDPICWFGEADLRKYGIFLGSVGPDRLYKGLGPALRAAKPNFKFYDQLFYPAHQSKTYNGLNGCSRIRYKKRVPHNM